MKKATAVYMKADPFTYNEMDIVRKSIDTFGFVHILLDRKNRDSQFGPYKLSFQDRSEIIDHELKQTNKIDEYDIIPIDITIQKTMIDNDIGCLVLNYDYQKDTGFEAYGFLRYILDDVNVMMLSGQKYGCIDIVERLLDSDDTMMRYKDYCSDYSFGRLKLKTVYKIAITGDNDDELDVIQDVFAERNVRIVDLDEFTAKMKSRKNQLQEIMKYVAKIITGEFDQKIVIRGKSIFDSGIGDVFDSTILATDYRNGNVENDVDCVINFKSGEEYARNQMIKLFNQRYSRL